MKKIKQYTSTKILDLVDNLPKFRGGIVASLQTIRDHQRRISTKEFENRKAPEGSFINLKELIMVATFEFEEFRIIQNGFKRLFPKNEKILNFIKDLKNKENDIHELSWHNIGIVSSDREKFFPYTMVINELPECVEYIHLTYHRIMPSFVAVFFIFELKQDFSDRLRQIQDKEHLSPVIFKKLWPIHKLHHSYSMGGGKSGACEAIELELTKKKDELKKWVENNLKWNTAKSQNISFVDVYEITGNPNEIDELKKWKESNRGWLADYGIMTHGFNTFNGDGLIYCRENSSLSNCEIIVKFETADKSHYGDFFEFKARSTAVISALYTVIDKYRNKLEKLRALGFKSLNKVNRGLLKQGTKIQELKKLITLINRVEHETTHSKHWIISSISEIGPICDGKGEEICLGDLVVDNISHHIELIKTSANIIDTGLTNYISVQSIYVMYKLQRWMFVLSIVVTIATIVSVLTGWEKLKDFWQLLINFA